jgi:hypothetical protein
LPALTPPVWHFYLKPAAALRERGYDLIAVDSPGSFLEDTPTAALIRQVLGAVSQFEKASLVGF